MWLFDFCIIPWEDYLFNYFVHSIIKSFLLLLLIFENFLCILRTFPFLHKWFSNVSHSVFSKYQFEKKSQFWWNPIYIYFFCIVNCSILGKKKNKERVSNEELMWLKHDMYIYKISWQLPLKLWTYTLKNELQGSKTCPI
jgi:hypothetical protein